MTDYLILESIVAALEAEIAGLQSQISTLESTLAALPPISESGPGTSFSINTSSQLKTLNEILGMKTEQLRSMKELTGASGPGIVRC